MKTYQEILELERTLLKLDNLHASFDYLKISLASPRRIKSWAQRTLLDTGEVLGEVLRPETINFRTHKPEVFGLFCERTFGPIKSWKCACGKYQGFAIDKVCEDCRVEITEARVRRYRMGYIELTCPVAHSWYFKGMPNYLLTILRIFDEEMKQSDIENVIYYQEYKGEDFFEPFLWIKPKNNSSFEKEKLFLNELDPFIKWSLSTKPKRRRRRGSEILKAALESLNLEDEIKNARTMIGSRVYVELNKKVEPDKTLIRRIRILESFLSTKTNPSWMILTNLPILPPNLRPLVELESGRLVAADVNELYRLLLTRNQRLYDFLYKYVAPEMVRIQGRRLLQEGLDCLIDNSRVPKNKTCSLNNKALKSLTEILEGKQGRFRQSLLGKRVDYSGRSVIIVGPHLRLNQCGLPYEMAAELFQPFLIHELLKTKIKAPSHNTRLAHIIIKKNKPFIWVLLQRLTRKHCILLNRAPTLHRFGIQAFDPVIILGQAIHLHPLVCTGFNADFDGDQMAVHLPLYDSSQLEARTMMRPSYNVLSPSNGEVILKPTQDMVIGCYYLTFMIHQNKSILKKWFSNEEDALKAFYQKKITIHTPILIRYSILNFKIKMEKNTLKFINKYSFLTEKEIFLYQFFQVGSQKEKYYLITSIGILIVHKKQKNEYELTDLFLETSPGRLIFSMNLKSIMKKENL